MLCEIAWVIDGKRNTYLSAWYWRIKQNKEAKKAVVALARKRLVIIFIWWILFWNSSQKMWEEATFQIHRRTGKARLPRGMPNLNEPFIWRITHTALFAMHSWLLKTFVVNVQFCYELFIFVAKYNVEKVDPFWHLNYCIGLLLFLLEIGKKKLLQNK